MSKKLDDAIVKRCKMMLEHTGIDHYPRHLDINDPKDAGILLLSLEATAKALGLPPLPEEPKPKPPRSGRTRIDTLEIDEDN